MNPLGANHPMLIFNHVITVGSRIAISFLYKNLSKKFHPLRLTRDCAFLMVELIKVFCIKYFKHFHYGGFIKLYNNIFSDVPHKFNKSCIVITKKYEQ